MTQFEHKLISQAKKTKGYLNKKSSSTFSSWKKKYFIFMEQSLSIFNDETLQSLQKSIMFQTIKEVNARQEFIIEIKLVKKVYYLRAESTADQDLWIASLNILRENHDEQIKSLSKKSLSSSHSLQKRYLQNESQSMEKKSVSSSMRSIETKGEKTKVQNNAIKNPQKQKITYLLRQKQLSKLLALLGLERLSLVTKEEKYLKRILFIQDKKNGIYFSLSSKSIYPIIDSDLLREDFIYPYQLNVLYFLPIETYKYAIENKILSIKLQQVCKCSEILQCSLFNPTTLRLHIDCSKPLDIEVKQLSQSHVGKLLQCVKKMAEVGKQYWNPKGKLMRNIDQFVMKYYQNEGNQIVFYKMVESEFNATINIEANRKVDGSMSSISNMPKNQSSISVNVESHLNKVQSLTTNLKGFSQACDIKATPLKEIKQKYVRLFHKFVYNHLNQNWTFLYNNATQQELVMYAKKVYNYYVVVGQVYNDQRVKQGCKTLVKIVLGKFFKTVEGLIDNFSNTEEEACRILKKYDVNINLKGAEQDSFLQNGNNNKIQENQIFFSTFCTNLMSLISADFRILCQLQKSDQLLRLAWTTMTKIIKHSLQKLSILTQSYKERSSLISVTNSLRIIRNHRLVQMFESLQKSVLFNSLACKRQKQDFQKQVNNEMIMVENFCIKKLFVITFSKIDKQLLKHQVPNIDFGKICSIVIEEITKLEYILPDVRLTMFESAFQEVCYFFYICVVKYDNSRSMLSKDQCLTMINAKMLAIRDSFVNKVEEDKIHNLLKDLNLLKQFITCPIGSIKSITRELKKVFGSNFAELNLKNLITLRTSTFKQKQHLFEQCRQEIKTGSSFNSNQELQSLNTQRQSFLNTRNSSTNNNTSHRHRVSTLTQSLKSYTEHFDHFESIPKKNRTILFGVENSIYEGYIYRKKIIKNFKNTNYARLFYRLKKGKLFQYDNEYCEDILNCYLLEKLRKCYPQQGKEECFFLQFQKQTVKFKLSSPDDASKWIMKILEAMEEQKSLLELNQLEFQQEGALFQDLEKKITYETKSTQQPQSSPKNPHVVKMIKKQSGNQSPDGKVSLLTPKKTQNTPGSATLSGSTNNNRKAINSPTKLKLQKQKQKKAQMSKNKQRQKSKQRKGCGTGCNFF